MTPYARSNIIAQRHSREAMADTSYTTKVEQMTEPIVDITMFALYHAGLLGYRDMHLSIVPAA